MLVTASSAVALLLLVLPGFLAYRFAVLRRDDPTRVSPLWQLSEILEYSAYVHLIGVALSAAIAATLERGFGIATHAGNLVRVEPSEFLKSHPWEAGLWLILYSIYVIISATLLGTWDFPKLVRESIFRFSIGVAKSVFQRLPCFRGIALPIEPYPQNPVWQYAFDIRVNNYGNVIPLVIVTMKSGDVYFGRLVTYPIVPDTENEKDFLIDNTRFYKQGNPDDERNLSKLDGVGAVLLNTVNVESIQIYYHRLAEPGN